MYRVFCLQINMVQGRPTKVSSLNKQNSRVVHSPINGVEEIIVDSREVVTMHVTCDAGPPTNIHQTSSKLCPTLALYVHISCKYSINTYFRLGIFFFSPLMTPPTHFTSCSKNFLCRILVLKVVPNDENFQYGLR